MCVCACCIGISIICEHSVCVCACCIGMRECVCVRVSMRFGVGWGDRQTNTETESAREKNYHVFQ